MPGACKLSPRTGVLSAVTAAVEAMPVAQPVRAGHGRALAQGRLSIDQADDDAKAVGYLGRNLSAVLRALGGAPAERTAPGVEEQVAGKLLPALRSSRT